MNTEVASKAIKDVYANYKKYVDNSRKQTKYLQDNFSQNKMTEVLKQYMDDVKVSVNVPFNGPNQQLKLPKLKKATSSGEKSLPTLKLPKLKKVNG